MAEQFTTRERVYRGMKIDELRKLDTREFAKLLKSRARRAIMRNFNVVESFVKRCEKRKSRNKQIRTHLRELVIVPALVGLTINVHNGKEFLPVQINEDMLGHRLGEFTLTRKPVKHGAAGVGATKSSSSLSVK